MAATAESQPAPAKEKIHLTGVEETLLSVLKVKALDAQSAAPILGDPYSQRFLDRCDVDYARSTVRPTDQRYVTYVASRSRLFDGWCQDFLDRHAARGTPVTVVHVACGLDCRALRVNRRTNDDDGESMVRWIDLDQPAVVALRERIARLEGAPGGDYALRPLTVTGAAWLGDIPNDRPTLVLAEGVFPYFPPDVAHAVIRNLVDHFGCRGAGAGAGELVLDTVSGLFVRHVDHVEFLRSSGAAWQWGVEDARAEIEALHPALRMRDRVYACHLMGGSGAGWWDLAQSHPPWFGEGVVGRLKMALASLAGGDGVDNSGQFVRFEFSRDIEQGQA